ncbi:hypothetical protein [Streptomyces coffeae]|uniref:Gram-positive cocci surface proteins LPxTG domain-containing protein n=1 Tax=Streptomyces coffeae TaxID=621382 RepID=A0ABS1N7W2_9ACTN|nr:hypothetical protein [Streptomyces coffeae]MBL1096171.1 hypothetical protein [Streptomyces coffeae]
MNPALRTLPAAVLLVGAVLSAAPMARADDGGLAGTHAGEGRTHPGRTDTSTASPPDDDGGVNEEGEGGRSWQLVPRWTPSSLTVPETGEPPMARDLAPSERRYETRRTAAEPGDQAMRVLPLGTGLALTGLGLGLAFLGLRLRRQ